jgi:Concanavalin A-like lectin/glucanases superfamily
VAVRLPLDANLIGYWGFDEALETDAARDATTNALHLTVTSSPAGALGRVGGARDLNGTSSFASVTSPLLRLTSDWLLLGWFKLDTVNTGGSLLRCFVSCGGPTVGDGVLYALSVKNNGALEYRHTAAAGEVLVTTAVGTIRTAQFYSVAVRRIANGPDQDIEIYLDNQLVAITSVTVNGSPSALPVPPPAANASAIFSVGRLQRVADSAFWDGLVDEVSIHDTARPYQPYLIAAYYQAALRSATTKLTATDNVVAVSSYEMGSGVRWWCVERDRDLYVVKESPFGNFGSETRLTTPGGGNSSNTGRPELLYDAALDTLYVFFFAGNRIFKLTANSTDDPATVNMPFTADTGGIIKSMVGVWVTELDKGIPVQTMTWCTSTDSQ